MPSYMCTEAFLWNVYIAHNVYFQYSSFINKIINPPRIKKNT